MMFLLTNPVDNYGFICRSENQQSFIYCFDELENQFQMRVNHCEIDDDGRLDYVLEERNGQNVLWAVSVIESGEEICQTEDVLVLIGGE
jgi:hypothetical protein